MDFNKWIISVKSACQQSNFMKKIVLLFFNRIKLLKATQAPYRMKLQQKIMNINWIYFLFLISLLSCNNQIKNEPSKNDIPNVDGFVAIKQNFASKIQATGELLPYEEVEITAPFSGNIIKINFEEGQYKEKGELIIEIDSRIYNAQKLGLEANLKVMEKTISRKKSLLEVGGATQEEIEIMEAEAESLKAKIAELDVKIDLAQIRAPFSGYIGLRNISTGAFVNQGTVITQLTDNKKIKVQFTIPARFASKAKTGQIIIILISGTVDTANAEIYAIDPIINKDSRSLQIKAILNNTENQYFAGDFAQIIYNYDFNENSILIPAEAITPELNSQVVYLYKNGFSQKQKVVLGERTKDMVQITNGINPGDTIIISGLMRIADKQAFNINIINSEETI